MQNARSPENVSGERGIFSARSMDACSRAAAEPVRDLRCSGCSARFWVYRVMACHHQHIVLPIHSLIALIAKKKKLLPLPPSFTRCRKG